MTMGQGTQDGGLASRLHPTFGQWSSSRGRWLVQETFLLAQRQESRRLMVTLGQGSRRGVSLEGSPRW